MITEIDISVKGKGYTETGYLFTEAGDTLILKGTPVLGATGFGGIIVKTEGEGLLSKFLRYSVDSLNWSEWFDLSDLEIRDLVIDPQHFLSFEVKLVLETTTSIILKSIEVNFRYSIPDEPSFYKEFPLSKFVPYYNYPSIEWSLNILEKVYRQGIVPKYIERGSNENWCDKDYIDFWFPIIYYFSLNLAFNKIFKDLVWYPALLYEYLRQKGLFLGSRVKLAELFYLMEHYYSEIMKRGSLACLVDKFDSNTGVTIRSELSRLIDKRDFDEFLMAVIDSDENGWTVGRTCCGFTETDTYKGFIKGYEDTEEVVDISKYPLLNPEEYSIISGKLVHETNNFHLGQKGGLTPLIPVNPHNSYEVSFKFKAVTSDKAPLVRITTACEGLDSLRLPLENSLEGGNLIQEFEMYSKSEKEYYLKFCIYGLEEAQEILELNTVYGATKNLNGLKFKSEAVKFISPYIHIDGQTLEGLYVWDIKVRLLDRKDVFLSDVTEVVMFLKNNNIQLTNSKVGEIIKNYLLPLTYNVNFRYE